MHFIFGQAEYGEEEETRAAVVSIVRPLLGIDTTKEKSIYFERVLKESIHEIGHTLDLDHCPHDCVMKKSSVVSDIDKKSLFFCRKCKESLQIR